MIEVNEATKDYVCEAIYDAEMETATGETVRALIFDKVILTSGMFSVVYINHRLMTAFPEYADRIVLAQANIVEQTDANFIVSSERAGVYWGSRVAGRLNMGFASVGKDRTLCGVMPKNARAICVDDLNTTYGTALVVAGAVREVRGNIKDFVVDVDREEPISEQKAKFRDSGYTLARVLTLKEIISYGIKSNRIGSVKSELIAACEEDPDSFAINIIRSNPVWVAEHERLERAKKFYANNERVRPVLEEAIASVVG
jgi:orotate phosphoribosyltransferase